MPKLRMKKRSKTAHPLYFIPTDMMIPSAIESYKDVLVEEDESTQQVEAVLGDVTDLSEVGVSDPRN